MKKIIGLTIFSFWVTLIYPQSFAINIDGSTAHSSAILDVKSDTKGVLIPRVSKAQKNAIVTPAPGLLVYQISPDSIGFHYYIGTHWLWLEALENKVWKTNGNSGTDTAINYIGTNDNMPLRFKQNNIKLAQWDLAKGNYFLGDAAGYLKPALMENSIAIGDSALASSGDLISPTSNHSIAIGYKALKNHQSQIGNVAVGAFTLQNFQDNTAGGGGFGSVAMGYAALNKLKNGQANVGIGVSALFNDTIGTGNIGIGYQAMVLKKNGNFNIGIGNNAGVSLRIGTENTYLGANSLSLLDSLNNATAIGSRAQVDTSNAMVLGSIFGINSATAYVNVGIGTTKPKYPLHVSRGNSGSVITNSNRIATFEDNSSNYIQLLSQSTNETGILAGNAETLIKSGIVFQNDSSIAFKTGGNITTVLIQDTGNVGVGNNFPSSKLTVNGSLSLPIRIITSSATATITATDHTIIINSAGGAIPVTLPLVTGTPGREYIIVNQNTFTHTTNFAYRDFTNTPTNTIPVNSSITLQGSGSFWYRIR